MKHLTKTIALTLIWAACTRPSNDANEQYKEPYPKKTRQPTEGVRVATLRGLHGPESVRYDPQLDVYYVSNMAGYGSTKDDNGYILKVSADNLSNSAILVEGGVNGVTLDAPKGLAVHGDTVWAADITVLRGFHRLTGAPLATIDLAPQGAVLLNDITIGEDGRIYVSDTGILMTSVGVLHPGGDKIFAIGPQGVSIIAQGNQLGRPNGVTWDKQNHRLLVASFDPFHSEVYAIAPGSTQRLVLSNWKGKFDGLEILPDGRRAVASWVDSAVLVFDGNKATRIADNIATPADIGVDTKRNRLAIPSTAMDRVELWQLGARD